MDTSIIISRYNEDLSWLDKYKEFNLIIYNKGLNNIRNKFNNLIKLPNVGRESHSWLFHIIKNYNNLSDVNIFLQGRIDDLGCMAFKSPYEYIKDTEKNGYSVKRFGLLGPLHWKDYLGIEKNPRYNKKWFNKAIVQYDNFSEEVQLYFRINWIHTPGSDLFIVINNRYKLINNSFNQLQQTQVVKLTYQIQI